MEKEKYLSIITNFGCHYKCPYCIIKKNNIKVSKTTLKGLDKLEECLKSTNANIISISGGGDPLFEYEKHRDWYEKLIAISLKLQIPMEMHTSYMTTDIIDFPFFLFKRVVYHANNFSDLLKIRKQKDEIVRAVFVVDETYTEEGIKAIAELVKSNSQIDELSFRQLVDENYEVKNYLHNFLKTGHKKDWWYIEQRDYNDYYVEGKIYKDFSKIGVE